MFKNSYQNGLLSIFYSCGAHPLALWDMEVKNGHIKRITDSEVNSLVLEIVSTNVATTYMSCPRDKQVLGIKLPFLVMIVKNLKRYFSFEITILDDKNMRRRFRISNFQSTTKIKPFCTSMPIGLSGGWNQIQFNLADFTRRAYGTQFIETLRVQVHANVRLRRIYFAERLFSEEELPQEYKLYLPLEKKLKKKEKEKKEEGEEAKATAAAAVPAPAPTPPPVAEPEVKPEPAPDGAPTPEPESAATMTPVSEVEDEKQPQMEAPAVEGESPAAEGGETPGDETAEIKAETPAEEGTETPVEAPAEEGEEPPTGAVEEIKEENAEAAPAPESAEPPAEAEAPPAEEAPPESAAETPAE